VSGRRWRGGALATPYVVGLLLLLAVPAAFSTGLAFSAYDGFTAPQFTGLENVRRMLSDGEFGRSLRNGALLALLVVPLRLVLATGAALLLEKRFRGVGMARTAVYLPSVVPDAAWALLWLWLLNPLYGPVPSALGAAGVQSGLLTDAWPTRIGLALMLALQVGESFIVALATRRMIPDRLYQVAAIEGASAWFTVRKVTLPLMAPVLALLALRDVILVSQVTLVPVLMVTDGGPHASTMTPPLVIYERSFVSGEWGYASMLSLSLLVSTAVVVGILLLVARPWRRAASAGLSSP
jgi:multiple sugar transport system permease protein